MPSVKLAWHYISVSKEMITYRGIVIRSVMFKTLGMRGLARTGAAEERESSRGRGAGLFIRAPHLRPRVSVDESRQVAPAP